MTEPVLRAESLTKVYDIGKVKLKALDSVSLSIDEGEFVAIMGPSGSGKSTLLHLIGCLDRPTSGRLKIDGKDASNLSRKQLAHLRGRYIGFVFQMFNLIPRISALDNVKLPMSFARIVPSKEREQRAYELLEMVGLADRTRHRPSELSGGEQQRVAIARALANNPKIILADEPTGNLDTKTGSSIMELFQKLNEDKRTILVVTHDQAVASYAKRIVHLVDGRIQGQELS